MLQLFVYLILKQQKSDLWAVNNEQLSVIITSFITVDQLSPFRRFLFHLITSNKFSPICILRRGNKA